MAAKRKSAGVRKTGKTEKVAGVIRAGEAYVKSEALERLNISQRTWQRLRKRGLETCLIGGRSWVLSDDILAFLAKHKTTGLDGGAGEPDPPAEGGGGDVF